MPGLGKANIILFSISLATVWSHGHTYLQGSLENVVCCMFRKKKWDCYLTRVPGLGTFSCFSSEVSSHQFFKDSFCSSSYDLSGESIINLL